MFRLNLSSNSQSEDENIEGHYKKVYYQGNFSDSEHQDSQMDDSGSEDSKKAAHFHRKPTVNKSSEPLDKSKAIKKNCESAKQSRQRKKVYLELLEQRAQQLKIQIYNRKNNIRGISSRILHKFTHSNREKHKFLLEKLALSKKLLTLTEEIQQMRKGAEEKPLENALLGENSHAEIHKNISPETLLSAEAAHNAHQEAKAKGKKKKGEEQKKELSKEELEEKIAQKEGYLELAINAYMYQFGVRGCLRADVLDRTKFQWFQNIQKSLSSRNSQTLSLSLGRMRCLLQRLQERTKKLDYYLRELKGRVRQRFVVQFLLDRQFFIHNSGDTIYKNTPIAPAEPSNNDLS